MNTPLSSIPGQGPVARSYWVREGELLAGPYPGRAIDTLVGAGVTAIVNLTEAHEGNYTGYMPHGVTYRHHPVGDFETPPLEQVREILDDIDALLADDETVYVHCWAGIGRTGTIVGCWLVRHGMSGEDALALLRERRGRLPETPDQRAMVRHWSEDDPDE